MDCLEDCTSVHALQKPEVVSCDMRSLCLLTCPSLTAPASALDYDHKTHRLFVGLGSGVIHVSACICAGVALVSVAPPPPCEPNQSTNHAESRPCHQGTVQSWPFVTRC